jgi:hypothetical protein
LTVEPQSWTATIKPANPTAVTEDTVPKRPSDHEAAIDFAVGRWIRVAIATAILLIGVGMIIHGYHQEQRKLNTVALCVR